MHVFYMPLGIKRETVTLQGQKIATVEQLKFGKAGITAGIYIKCHYSCLLGIYHYFVSDYIKLINCCSS